MLPGFYVAHHSWLDHVYGAGNLFKVGHTGDLSRRLHDDAYVTCFGPPDWHYALTYETDTKEDAERVESEVLHCCRNYRQGTKELINLTAGEIEQIAAGVTRALGITARPKQAPVYAPAEVRRGVVVGGAEPTVKVERADEKAPSSANHSLVEHLTIPSREVLAARAKEEMDDYLADLINGEAPPVILPPKPSAIMTAVKAVAATVVKAIKPAPAVAAPAIEDEPMDEYVVLDERGRALDDFRAVSLETREYQEDAAEACLYELKRSNKAVLQMACRCGKTRVAHMVIEDYLAAGGRALWLVPGLPLLRQTAQKLVAYGGEVRVSDILLVGSDSVAITVGEDTELTMTTDREGVEQFLESHPRALIISTYQSSAVIPAGTAIAVTVFDEAHRTTGDKKARPFNHTLMLKRPGHQLSMTATPGYGKDLSMDDTSLYGGIAYRYYMRQGIDAGYVNSFRLELVAAGVEKGISPTGPTAAALLVQQIVSASQTVDKLLVFCKHIAHATRLCQDVSLALAVDRPTTRCLIAHSRMGKGEVGHSLRAFGAEGVRAIMFNVRLFGEGVEIPMLGGVFFAAPRHSARDIIQSLCRPLNKVDGKPESVIFLPVMVEKGKPIADPDNLERFASIVPVVDALMVEDPTLYEHLLNPGNKPYPITVLGTKSLGLTTDLARKNLLTAVRKAVRYNGNGKVERLTRADNIPWQTGFAELRRVVLECNRYPKTTDAFLIGEVKVNFHHFYRHCADQYAAWRDGKPTKLEPYQLRDLETLHDFDLYGVEGPYPWNQCMQYLSQHLEEHGGVPPMLEINKGGYVGLDASALERLSGCLTCINQGDGKDRKNSKKTGSGFTISAQKQADLDRICSRFGLRWRKERNADGSLVEGGPQTFIQEAHSRFKAYYKDFKDGKNDGSFITTYYEGYPLKHSRQENPGTKKDSLPPRWKTRRAKPKA